MKRPAKEVDPPASNPLDLFHPAVREWFEAVFPAPTRPQLLGWPAIARGDSTLILAPTGTGKTLSAFLWAIDRLMFRPVPAAAERCRVLYISPIKALAVDLERLEQLCGRKLQRIGLSATQRPLEEVANFLGGAEGGSPRKASDQNDAHDFLDAELSAAAVRYRPVTIIDAGAPKKLDLCVEV